MSDERWPSWRPAVDKMSAHRHCEYNCGGTACDAPNRPSRQAIVKLDEISQEAAKKMDEIVRPSRRFTDKKMKLTPHGMFFIGWLLFMGWLFWINY